MKELSDYYKFHVEIPRIYMLPISIVCNCKFLLKNLIIYYYYKII